MSVSWWSAPSHSTAGDWWDSNSCQETRTKQVDHHQHRFFLQIPTIPLLSTCRHLWGFNCGQYVNISWLSGNLRCAVVDYLSVLRPETRDLMIETIHLELIVFSRTMNSLREISCLNRVANQYCKIIICQCIIYLSSSQHNQCCRLIKNLQWKVTPDMLIWLE